MQYASECGFFVFLFVGNDDNHYHKSLYFPRKDILNLSFCVTDSGGMLLAKQPVQ